MTAVQETLLSLPQAAKTSDDYYTPPWMFELLDITFDLDVCAPEGGIHWIPAAHYFAISDDGLSQPWLGRVWMNPPYSKPSPWVDRFIDHRHGIALVPFEKSAWFDRLWEAADGVVAPGVRASKFIGGPISKPVMLAAFGDECREAIGRAGRLR